MRKLKIYSVITELMEVGLDEYHTRGLYYKTELRGYELYILNKENDVYTVEDLNEEEFSGTIDELCEMANNGELSPDGWNDIKNGFVINLKIVDEYDNYNEENHSKWYGECFYKSLEDANSAFKEQQLFWVKNF